MGVKGGISITAFGVMAVRDAAPGHATIQGDIKIGFNEVQREHAARGEKIREA